MLVGMDRLETAASLLFGALVIFHETQGMRSMFKPSSISLSLSLLPDHNHPRAAKSPLVSESFIPDVCNERT